MDKQERKTNEGNGAGVRHNDVDDRAAVEAVFDRYPREITILLGWFISGHLTRLYRLFEGDMILLIVLGEIAHHNISPFFDGARSSHQDGIADWKLGYSQDALQPCNAFSISESTGIPRETCRRKVQQLLQRGLLERHPKGGYIITPQVRTHYRDFNRETFVRWMAVTRELDKIVASAQPT